ncbi:flagellar protein FlgN [Deltaproteobacteria bacterium OttesenSCG-928-K17]|nr:flagellar protein FlgN [Deltaproteobacteria bacterium OttesenSCG-928-K17]
MDLTRVQHLCNILDGHLERYQTLVDYVAMEKKYLLELDLDGLFASSKMKEELALDIQANIQTLVECIKETALMLGLAIEPQPLLADLAPHLPTPFDNYVNDGAIRLERLKNTIQRENEANRQFVDESLRLINESVDILTGANQLKGDGYNSDGSAGEKKNTLPIKLSRSV